MPCGRRFRPQTLYPPFSFSGLPNLASQAPSLLFRNPSNDLTLAFYQTAANAGRDGAFEFVVDGGTDTSKPEISGGVVNGRFLVPPAPTDHGKQILDQSISAVITDITAARNQDSLFSEEYIPPRGRPQSGVKHIPNYRADPLESERTRHVANGRLAVTPSPRRERRPDGGHKVVYVVLVNGMRRVLLLGSPRSLLRMGFGPSQARFRGFARFVRRSRYAKGSSPVSCFVSIGSVTKAPGQPPCCSITSSISFMRRIVSFKATTIR